MWDLRDINTPPGYPCFHSCQSSVTWSLWLHTVRLPWPLMEAASPSDGWECFNLHDSDKNLKIAKASMILKYAMQRTEPPPGETQLFYYWSCLLLQSCEGTFPQTTWASASQNCSLHPCLLCWSHKYLDCVYKQCAVHIDAVTQIKWPRPEGERLHTNTTCSNKGRKICCALAIFTVSYNRRWGWGGGGVWLYHL